MLWREGRAAEALERKMEDGDLLLVAGGRAATIRRVAVHWQERRPASEPLLVVVPTNEDVRDVSIAIRAQRQQEGDLGDDLVVIRSIDRNTGQVHDMAIAAGDRVRTFERIYDADAVGRRRPIANNGDPLEVRSADTDGLVVRNELTGVEGRVPWAKLQQERGGEVGLGYAYASTIHTAQSQSAPGVIWALPDGSRSVNAFSAYTAASRQQYRVSIVVNEAAERRQIHRRRMLGSSNRSARPMSSATWPTICRVNPRRQQRRICSAAPDRSIGVRCEIFKPVLNRSSAPGRLIDQRSTACMSTTWRNGRPCCGVWSSTPGNYANG